jgi:hypothetical protein
MQDNVVPAAPWREGRAGQEIPSLEANVKKTYHRQSNVNQKRYFVGIARLLVYSF